MLEGSHLFFILLAVLFFVYLIRKKSKITLLNYLIFGALTGLAVSVKATGAIVFFLFPFLFIADYKYPISRTVLDIGKNVILKGVFVVVGFPCYLRRNLADSFFFRENSFKRQILQSFGKLQRNNEKCRDGRPEKFSDDV